MKNLVSMMIVALVLAFTSFALAQDREVPKELANVDVKALPQGNQQFAIDLYRQLAKSKGNLFFSPHSISEAMAMTYLGAGGETKAEMAKVLCVPMGHNTQTEVTSWTDQELAAGYKDLHSRLSEAEKFKLHIANALWGQEGLEFREPFVKLVDKEFGGKLGRVDFAQPDQACKTINDWVAKQTNDKIKNLVSPDVVNSNTVLVLTNAIYFKGQWWHQFKKEATKKATFNVSADKSVQMPMMSQTDRHWYGETEGVKVLEMGYDGGTIVMTVLLPEKPEGLAMLEEKITAKGEKAKGLEPYLKSLEMGQVHVSLPKFKIEQEFSLKDTLKAMGMKLAFSGKADFSNMCDKKSLFIGAVLHKAFVDVDENGTEAAAATAVAMWENAVRPGKPKEFVADHPFLFLIRDRESGAVLFMGRVADPSK